MEWNAVLTHAADFPAFKLGTRTRVSRDGLREWVRKRSEKEEAASVQEHRSGQR